MGGDVEVVAPYRHQTAGMAQGVEEMLFQKFIHRPAIHVHMHEWRASGLMLFQNADDLFFREP